MIDQSNNLTTVSRVASFTTENWDLIKRDCEFKHLSWDDLRHVISTNKLDALVRTPSESARYDEWGATTRAQYGSVMNYLIAHRFPKAWGEAQPFVPKSNIPFQDRSDYIVLLNHWPYALEPGIVHIVVWSRTPIAVDSEKGDLLPESRKLVDDFVNRAFTDALGERGAEKVLWFKNWVGLQSVRALDHVHVMVKDIDRDTLDRWTRPMD